MPINRLSRVFGFSRSSFYHIKCYRPKENVRKTVVIKHMLSIYDSSHGTYGSPRLTLALRKEGIHVARRTVANYMRELNLKSIMFKRFRYKKTNFKDNAYALLKNVAKDVNVNRINQVWTQDVTYLKLSDGSNAYLASVMDLYSRKIIYYELSRGMTADLICRVLYNAYKIRKPGKGLILHSDKGAQYRSDKYKNFAYEHKAICSYTRIVFSCADNACQESFHASFKKECFYQRKPQTFEETRALVFRYIDGFYNPKRLHSKLGYKSPDQFEKEFLAKEKYRIEMQKEGEVIN